MAKLIPFGNRALVDELFGDLNPGFFIRPLHGDPLPSHIKLELKEDKGHYTVVAELPGLNKDDIHVSVENNIVTISAEIQQEDKQTDDEKVLRSERYYGSVSRRIELPCDVDMTQAVATYKQGLLALRLPKKTSSSPSRLIIS